MKVTVRIHTAQGVQFKKVKVKPGSMLRLRKKPVWDAQLTDYEVQHKWFGRVKFYTDIWENAKQTWSYESGLKPEDQPELTQEQITKYAKADIFKRRYQTEVKPISSWILYLILIIQIGSMAFTYLLQSGRLRL